ncbi:Mannan endo-1,4-beta-mannosidase 5 [Senna tora]|uniref:mannan endo-1,4-beta-mannosidase n=1 Tax=Senna tora TaxID=362788 RepID=A0A834WL72_9FABA|nr:Mannan endo-1,4-beta-mannosidase 5 [Senna tora]
MNTITRTAYEDEEAIMAWELINEPRCQADYSGNTITEMGAYVKSIDGNHLLEVGMEGFYGDSIPRRKQYNPGYQVGTDFITSNLIQHIDFATIHAYPDNWLGDESEDVQEGFMQKWMTSHWEDSERILKKPLVLSEFGKSKKDKGYSINARDSYMNFVYSSFNNLAENGTFSGAMVWQLLDEGMDPYDDGYEIVLSQDTSTNSIITHQSSQIASFQHSYSASYK